MNDTLMMLGYLAPMVAVLGLFWNVARKLGQIESDLKQVQAENNRLRADLRALRDLLSVVIDSRRQSV
jgi:hypothetical protein